MIAIPAQFLNRTGALGAALFAGIIVLLIVVLPVASLFEQQGHERTAARQRLRAQGAQIAAAPALMLALADTRAKAEAAPGPFHSATPSLAEANLQSVMKDVIAASGGNLIVQQPMASTGQNGFDRVALQCVMTVPEGRLKGLLFAIETHVPLIFIDHASIAAPVSSQTDPRAGAPTALEVRLTVHAYRLKPMPFCAPGYGSRQRCGTLGTSLQFE